MKTKGVRVLVKNTNEYGYIIRRLNADNYEIWLDSGDVVTISPKEFIEKQGEEGA